MSLGIDLMGSELSPESIIAAALEVSDRMPSTLIHFFCTPQQKSLIPAGFSATFCKEIIQPEDHPLQTLRKLVDTTLYRGIDALRDGQIEGFLSLANTGAYIAKAAITLKPLFKDAKPALLAEIPSKLKTIAVLDVGAILVTHADLIVQLALLGSIYSKAAYPNRGKPKIALLNIGVESAKGTNELKVAHKLLTEHRNVLFEFIGNLEPNELFFSDVDVVVTTGFAGNIFLKTVEGTASFILDKIKSLGGESTHLNTLRASLYDLPSMGAHIVGLDGLLIKCHGSATQHDVKLAIISAVRKIQSGFMQKMKIFHSTKA